MTFAPYTEYYEQGWLYKYTYKSQNNFSFSNRSSTTTACMEDHIKSNFPNSANNCTFISARINVSAKEIDTGQGLLLLLISME
jgi:hypothetical protein